MALLTYANLTTEIASYLARSDLTSYIPDFITLFECSAARKLKVRLMEDTATLTPTGGVAALPSGYLGWKRLTWTGTPNVDLEYAHPGWLKAAYSSGESGVPQYFTIEESNIIVYPIDDTNLNLLFYVKNTAASSSLSWLFTNYPDAYLFGSLAEAAMFDKDEQRAAIWKQRTDAVFQEIELVDFREGAQLSIKPVGNIV